jgi:hypothetical protein
MTLVLILSFFAASCSSPSQQQATNDAEQAKEQAVSDMKNRLGAVTWQQRFGKPTYTRSRFTLQLQNSFAKDPSPTVVCVESVDILRKDDGYRVIAQTGVLADPEARFELHAAEDIVNKLLQIPVELFDTFAFAVRIQGVTRPTFKVIGQAETEEDVRLELDAADVFLANGILLEFVHMGKSLCK